MRNLLVGAACLLILGILPAADDREAIDKGPSAADTPGCKWGAVCADPVNGAQVWFGGVGGKSRQGGLGTWIFKDGAWTEAKLGTEPSRALHAKAVAQAENARLLYAAVANRFYLSENDKARAAVLDKLAQDLAGPLGTLAGEVSDAAAKKDAQEALARLQALVPRLRERPTIKEVAEARGLWQMLVALAKKLDAQPALRCQSALAFDPQTKKIVLFGGEGVHGAYADTWIYDPATRSWRQARPPLSPSPRIGHGLVARDGKVYLVGGQEPHGSMSYLAGLWRRLPMDVWEYDIAADRWTLLQAGTEKPTPVPTQPPVVLTLSDDGKKLSWEAPVMSYGKKVDTITGSCPLPGSDVGTAKAGVPPGTMKVRGEGFDPAWYEDAPAVDAAAAAAKLQNLPANQWVALNPPCKHVMRDWGTTLYDPATDQLLHWSGGHSSHCGTDVAHYSIATNRWHILDTPELPFEYTYSNDGAPFPSMTGRPWGPHAYLSYAVDSRTGKMLWTGRHSAYRLTNPGGSFVYDPATYLWSAPEMKMTADKLDPERHKTCMVATPHGLILWADRTTGGGHASGLWRADLAARTYEPIVISDAKVQVLPPAAYGDRHGITYDSKRDRVLLFHFGVKDKHKIWACDLKTGKVAVLEPKGSDKFPAEVSEGREATYLPDDDLVIVCSRAKDTQKTLVYDCAADAWLELKDTAKEVKPGRFEPGYGVSWGVDWDPKRKLLWGVDSPGNVYVMRFDRKSAALEPLK